MWVVSVDPLLTICAYTGSTRLAGACSAHWARLVRSGLARQTRLGSAQLGRLFGSGSARQARLVGIGLVGARWNGLDPSAVTGRNATGLGILTASIVTTPLQFEGAHCRRLELEGVDQLRQVPETLVCVPNQNLFRLAVEGTSFVDAFRSGAGAGRRQARGPTRLELRSSEIACLIGAGPAGSRASGLLRVRRSCVGRA